MPLFWLRWGFCAGDFCLVLRPGDLLGCCFCMLLIMLLWFLLSGIFCVLIFVCFFFNAGGFEWCLLF